MNEHEVDQLLRIKTQSGLQLAGLSSHYNRYEATPYDALDALYVNYLFSSDDHVVDYGCGKGRVSFYLHHHAGVSVTGVEVNGQLYTDALDNARSYERKRRAVRGSLLFERCMAEEYTVRPDQNRFYFFNPFSVQIFMAVIGQMLESVEQSPRPVDLILYYPTAEYIQFLEDRTPFDWLMEVEVPGWYEQDENERFVIFRLER